MTEKRFGVVVTGVCRICNFEGRTEMHHIISQNHCRNIGRPELIKSSGNIVELCSECHNNTTASLIAKNDIPLQAESIQDLEEQLENYRIRGYVPVSEISYEEFNFQNKRIKLFTQLVNRIGSQRAILYNNWPNFKPI
tara:strand:- start:152 stop:565 length:414 start_codon:yes stop_codon:yes gene_type:complete